MSAARSPGRESLLVALAFAVAALPMLLVAHPPVGDLPNHLARMWLLAGGLADPVLGAMWRADWSQASTNVAVDAGGVGLLRVLPLPIVSRLLTLALILLPALGGALLHRKLLGRTSAWSVIFVVAAFSTTAVAGFLAFQVSLGLGLVAAAAMHDRLRGHRGLATYAIHLAICALLLVVHPFGLLLYLAAAVAIVVGPGMPWRAGGITGGKIGRAALLGACALIPVVLLFLIAPNPPGDAAAILWPALGYVVSPGRIVRTLASPFITYDYRADGVFLLLAGGAVIGALLSRGARVHGGMILAAIALSLGALAGPLGVGDASWIQQRFAVMAALLLFAAIEPGAGRPAWRRAVIALVLVAALARVAWIGLVWHDRNRDADDLLAVARSMPRGASVLVVQQETPEAEQHIVGRYLQGGIGDPERSQRHLPALLVPAARVFVPTLFTIPGQQPLAVRDAWRDRSVETSAVPYPRVLGTADPRDPYVAHPRAFDYLLLIGADEPSPAPLDSRGLAPVARRGFAALYRVDR